jgi:hypothetical protein
VEVADSIVQLLMLNSTFPLEHSSEQLWELITEKKR